jgi:hypothetical protein
MLRRKIKKLRLKRIFHNHSKLGFTFSLNYDNKKNSAKAKPSVRAKRKAVAFIIKMAELPEASSYQKN